MSRVPEFKKLLAIVRTWLAFVPHYAILAATILSYIIVARKLPQAYLVRWKNYLPFLDCKWKLDAVYSWAETFVVLITIVFITFLFSKSAVFFILFGLPTIYHLAIANLDDPNG